MARIGNPDGSSSIHVEGKSIVDRLGGRWLDAGGMCRCPAHHDQNPSLSVRPGNRRLLFHCFAGCEPSEIIRALHRAGLMQPGRGVERRSVPQPSDCRRDHRAAALALWSSARTIEGTPAEAYLAARGLASRSAELRFHRTTPCGRGREALFLPAMIAAVRDAHGIIAVHRTFLGECRSGQPRTPRSKRALGGLGNGAVRLAPPLDGSLGLAEGIESALSATRLTGIPCWATLGAGRFGRIALPPGVARVVLFLDNDAGGRFAEALARRAPHLADVAVEVRKATGPGADWNDMLLAQDSPPSDALVVERPR